MTRVSVMRVYLISSLVYLPMTAISTNKQSAVGFPIEDNCLALFPLRIANVCCWGGCRNYSLRTGHRKAGIIFHRIRDDQVQKGRSGNTRKTGVGNTTCWLLVGVVCASLT